MPLHSPKSRYLLKHHEYLLIRACAFFPFTADEVRKYSPIINWYYLAVNHNVEWDVELIEEFKHQLFDKDGVFPEFNLNESLPWSVAFIERYIDEVEWELLSQNNSVVEDKTIRDRFYSELKPHEENVQRTLAYDGDNLDSDSFDFLDNFGFGKKYHPELYLNHPNEAVLIEDVDWVRMSRNENFDWSIELIDQYLDKWSWYNLTMNKSIPWDLKMLERYEDFLDWSVTERSDVKDTYSIVTHSVSSNLSIAWTREMLQRFRHKLDPETISVNENIKWSFELVRDFIDIFEPRLLALNNACWNKAFPEFNKRENLIPLLEILKKQMLN